VTAGKRHSTPRFPVLEARHIFERRTLHRRALSYTSPGTLPYLQSYYHRTWGRKTCHKLTLLDIRVARTKNRNRSAQLRDAAAVAGMYASACRHSVPGAPQPHMPSASTLYMDLHRYTPVLLHAPTSHRHMFSSCMHRRRRGRALHAWHPRRPRPRLAAHFSCSAVRPLPPLPPPDPRRRIPPIKGQGWLPPPRLPGLPNPTTGPGGARRSPLRQQASGCLAPPEPLKPTW